MVPAQQLPAAACGGVERVVAYLTGESAHLHAWRRYTTVCRLKSALSVDCAIMARRVWSKTPSPEVGVNPIAAPAPEASRSARYRSIRRTTLGLAAPLSAEDCALQSMPDASP